MKLDNPFESGHIKNYLLLYASVVVIMILFFFATTLFQDDQEKIAKKHFNTDASTLKKTESVTKDTHPKEKKFKMLDKAY